MSDVPGVNANIRLSDTRDSEKVLCSPSSIFLQDSGCSANTNPINLETLQSRTLGRAATMIDSPSSVDDIGQRNVLMTLSEDNVENGGQTLDGEGNEENDSDFELDEDADEFSVGDEESMSIASSVTDTESVTDDGVSRSAALSDRDSKTIAQREVRAARCGRCTAVLILVTTLGALLPVTLYHVTSTRQEASFEKQFDSLSEDLLGGLHDNLIQTFQALDGMAVDISLATASSAWPQITIPNFSTYSTQARNSASAIQSMTLAPIVTDSERQDYEAYVQINNQEWITQSEEWESAARDFDKSNRRLPDLAVNMSNGISDQIYQVTGSGAIVSPGPGPYHPIRHLHPVEKKSINYDIATNKYLRDELRIVTNNTSAIIGKFLEEEADRHVLLQNTLLSESAISDDLFVTFVYPITESLTPRGAIGGTTGSIVAIVSWIELLSSILPSEARGFVCVVENTCGQLASFRVDGRTATFIGFLDMHDTAFARYKKSYRLETLSFAGQSVSRLAVDEACSYEVHVYPSARTEEALSSFDPVILVAVAMGFFVFTICVIYVYDHFMERRNRAVLFSALEARAIVSSLFPANVRDRLFESTREERKRKKKLHKLNKKLRRMMKKLKDRESKVERAPLDQRENPEKAPRKSLTPDDRHFTMVLESVQPAVEAAFRRNDRKSLRHPKHELKNLMAASSVGVVDQDEDFGLAKPIADLFPHTTVIFADIVGFTAWSSEREPQDVFLLLQTIYHAFDKLAKRRGVFKVETIGDCYVAVTGLPEPQSDHAVRMTKFAKECNTKMTEVTKKLDVRLGPDTSDLSLRIGLHSGPVTAGVLQGEKSRFQLFGDTVNTASRMESTGERNRIHLSKSTADLLVAAGKSYWVKARQDLVHAKGKGFVQTFWLVSRDSVEVPQSSDEHERDSVPKRIAPPRSRSTIITGPTRGVQRTISDSIKKVDALSVSTLQNQQADELREERLIQWQVELFTRLLVKIVAARGEKLEAERGNSGGGWGGIAKSSNHSMSHSFNLSLEGSSDDDDDDGFASSSDLPARIPKRELSFRVPSHRGSFGATESLEASIGTFESLNDRTETGADASDPNQTDAPVSPVGIALGRGDNFNPIVVDEVAEIITLPKFDPKAIKALEHADKIKLDDGVVSQLRDFIVTVAQMYRNNQFHCFEHACHVTMATNKFLNRIVIPENVDYERESSDIASDLHTYTYGITSDPLTQFAIVFSALVHDVDHTGVPNGQLAKENPDMAEAYRNISLAEQNSVDLAWGLFMDPRYKKLQDHIAANKVERLRFRQLLVNCVMATDIFEPTMKALRNKRWDKAFHKGPSTNATGITDVIIEEDRNTKATIVLEHIIQASDVAHTMQHWHIYQKWNERLFNEMYTAYECGRGQNNPAENWYKGELWFFDNYVIPLAKKLEECNVFGVASAECLDYATANRNEWSVKGQEVVAAMVDRYEKRKFFVAPVARKRHLGAKQQSGRSIS